MGGRSCSDRGNPPLDCLAESKPSRWASRRRASAVRRGRVCRRRRVERKYPSETQREDERITVKGGRERGLVVHKLLEEVLTGETGEDTESFREPSKNAAFRTWCC